MTHVNETLLAIVTEAQTIAIENGYGDEQNQMSDYELACDMIGHDLVDDYPLPEIESAVAEYRRRRRLQQ